MTGDELTGRPWAQAPWELVTADISAQAFRVAMAIQLHRRPEGRAPFPGQKRLATMCRVAVPTVQRALRELQEAGILKVSRRRRVDGSYSTNSYSLHLPRITGDALTGITDDGTEVEEVKDEVEKILQPQAAGGLGGFTKAQRDATWDALEKATGIHPEGIGERSLFGKCVKELLQVGATPEEILSRAKRWPMRYPNATLTGRALVLHWGELAGRRPTPKVECPVCALKLDQAQLKEHLYDKHTIGWLCPECGKVVGEEEEHEHQRSGTS